MKKILFLTGTRADFGKLKPLIDKVNGSENFDLYLFVTGMHMLSKYGMTAHEIEKSGYQKIYKYINQNEGDSMDVIMAKTIQGFSDFVKEIQPDLIVVHGDRVEAMAGATVGALNNILVAHIEGGEVSGTIDELIRHAISKMSHVHFVSNDRAKERLTQLGERKDVVYVIGSPDLDVMKSENLPTLPFVKKHYEIPFKEYAIFTYHPVTTELESLEAHIHETVNALIESGRNYIVIYPNNDSGSKIILRELARVKEHSHFKVFPSLRFEYYLTLMKNAQFLIGNSSAGVREMPFYGRPSINVGTRQYQRSSAISIINVSENKESILKAIEKVQDISFVPLQEFGQGNSSELFMKILNGDSFWSVNRQKYFVDL